MLTKVSRHCSKSCKTLTPRFQSLVTNCAFDLIDKPVLAPTFMTKSKSLTQFDEHCDNH